MSGSSSVNPAVVGDGYLSVFNRNYFQCAARAYNITRFVIDELRMEDVVLSTSMCYWHEFTIIHGLRSVNTVVLAAACVFLAGKVEHYKLRVDQIVTLVFEVNANSNEEEAAGWRRMVLEVELVLSDTLKFDFQRSQLNKPMLEWLSRPYEKDSQNLSEAEKELVASVQATASRILTLSYISPLCVRASGDKVALTIACMCTYHSGHGAAYEHVWKAHPLPSEAERDGIIGVIVDAFAYMRKATGVAIIDDRIEGRRKRMRRETPSGVKPSAMGSSTTSQDITPATNNLER